jgi:hypothetical protein
MSKVELQEHPEYPHLRADHESPARAGLSRAGAASQDCAAFVSDHNVVVAEREGGTTGTAVGSWGKPEPALYARGIPPKDHGLLGPIVPEEKVRGVFDADRRAQ